MLAEIKSLFSDFLVQEDSAFVQGDTSNERFHNQEEMVGRIISMGSVAPYDTGKAKLKVTTDWQKKWGVVDQYNPQKGFGFLEVDGISGKVFVHAEDLRSEGHETLYVGDRVLCDIGKRAKKGLAVSKVHDVEVDAENISEASCEVIRFFPDRNYGFTRLVDTQDDVFFHYSSLPKEMVDTLSVGLRLSVETISFDGGQTRQVRRVLDIEEW